MNIRAGDEAVERIKVHARSTNRTEVIGGLGGFGGLFALNIQKYREPILVSGTDGVGTKLKLAFELDHHETVGVDLVAMCVNDILVSGAEKPLFQQVAFLLKKNRCYEGQMSENLSPNLQE